MTDNQTDAASHDRVRQTTMKGTQTYAQAERQHDQGLATTYLVIIMC